MLWSKIFSHLKKHYKIYNSFMADEYSLDKIKHQQALRQQGMKFYKVIQENL